jgi:hypothetical protein
LGATRAPAWFPRLRGWRDALPMAKPSSPLSNKQRSALSKGSRTVCKPKRQRQSDEGSHRQPPLREPVRGQFQNDGGRKFRRVY